MTGCLQVVVCDAPRPQDLAASYTKSITVKQKITGQSVVDLHLEAPRTRNRYKYHDTGSGCRFWCLTVLGDLELAGMVPSESSAEFDRYVLLKSEENPARFPMPTRRGTFY